MNLEHTNTLSTEHEPPAFARVLLPAVHSIRVLVACEYSGRVRDAFSAKGFDATSCDLLPSRTPGKHYQGNVMDIINDGWDLLIGFPPCTFISNVNTKWRSDIERLKQACKAMEFFAELYSAPIERIALENPVGMLSTCFRKPDQIIQPYYFGGNQMKTTCLWLKNLPKLHHVSQDNLFEKSTHGTLSEEFTSNKSHRQSHWYNKNKSERSTLFPAIANAMADQWSEVLLNCR
jgi:hypothetical protein